MTIQAYFHCKTCLGTESVGGGRLEVGMTDPQTITVHCATCDQHVGSFKLAEPLKAMTCGVCNEPIGPNHHH